MTDTVMVRPSEGNPGARAPVWVRAVEALSRAAGTVSGVVLAALALHIVVDVICRYFFHRPLPGTIDFIASWWMPVVAALAFAITEIEGEHISATLLADRLTGLQRSVIETFAATVTAAMAIWLAVVSTLVGVSAAQKGETAHGSGWLIIWPVRIVIVVGFVLFALAALARLYTIVRSFVSSPPPARDTVQGGRP